MVPFKDMFGKFGHVLNIRDSEPILKDHTSANMAELEAKAAMTLKVRDTFLFLGVMLQVEGFQGAECATRSWWILV